MRITTRRKRLAPFGNPMGERFDIVVSDLRVEARNYGSCADALNQLSGDVSLLDLDR